MGLVAERARSERGKTELILSHSPADGNAGPFYRKLGFEYTGKKAGDELLMRLRL